MGTESNRRSSAPPAASDAPPLIVLVDDDPMLISVLFDLLTGEGYRVEGYTDPVVALERLRAPLASQPAPAMMLVDCVMPRLSGGELLAAVRAAGVEVPVLLMTALSDPQFCVELGLASDVITKPFEVDQLLVQIRRTLGQRRAPGPSSRPSG